MKLGISNKKELIAPLLLIGLCAIPFLVNILTHTSPAIQAAETVYLWHPFQTFVKMAYADGRFPLWSPHFFCGMSIIGFAHTMPIYPLNFFALPLKYTEAVFPHFFIHLALLGLGIYILFRTLEINTWISFIIALALMSLHKPYALAFLNTMTWFPYILWMGIKFVRGGSIKNYLGIVAFSSLSILGGEVEVIANFFIWGIITSFLIALTTRFPRAAWERLILIYFSTSVMFMMAAPSILPNAEYASQSIRKFGFTYSYYHKIIQESFADFGLSAGLVIFLFICAFSMNVIAVLKRNIFLLSFAICIYMGIYICAPSHLDRVLYHIPIFRLFRAPARAAPLFVLWLSFVVANILTIISKKVPPKQLFVSGFILCGILTGFWLLRWPRSTLDLFDYSPKYASFFKSQKELARTINFYQYSFNPKLLRDIPVQSGALYNTQTIDGDVTIAPYYISRFLSMLDEDLLRFSDKKLDFNRIANYLKGWGIVRRANFRIFNLLNLRYLVSETGLETFKGPQLKKIYSDKNFVIYENVEAYPRAMAFREFRVEPDIEKALHFLSRAPSFDTRKTVIISEPPPDPAPGIHIGKTLNNEIKFLKYDFDRVEIFTGLTQPACLLLADSYYPGWVATSNGAPLKIHRVDVAFRGLFLGSGAHHVVFSFRPVSFKIGLWGSLTSILIWLSVFFRAFFLKEKA